MDQLPFKKKGEIRLRYAPSPTGPLHIGGARTALFNYLFAKRNQGSFILRIEDTDIARSDKKWEEDVLLNLKWLGIAWDEGPTLVSLRETKEIRNSKFKIQNYKEDYIGDYGPYRQSERKEIYERYIKKLFDEGFLYWCFCSKEELEARKGEQIARGEAPRYSGKCRNLKKEDVEKFKKEGRKGVLRFKVPTKIIQVQDLIRGRLEFDTAILGDIAVARDFSTPFYNLAVVIDDFEMKISHVIRGEDHLSNTPKQILFQEALGFSRPKYAHLPLILGPDRSKLSKRHGVVRVEEYKEEGYLPEALLNFVMLLGWNPGTKEEIFSLDELIERFSLERVQKGGAIFNIERLNWINGYYIRKISIGELTEKCLPYLIKDKRLKIKDKRYEITETGEVVDFNYLKNIISLFQERLKKLSEITELSDFFFKDSLSFDKKMLIWQEMKEKDVQKNLKKCYKILRKVKDYYPPTTLRIRRPPKTEWQREKIKDVLLKEAEKEVDRGRLLWPLRVALTGKEASPPPFEIAEILGREKTLKRIEEAIKLLEIQ